jgi:bifunctional DNA-binding transcriptional regulator/antitoxin component of YhaV-PrlF toxin-antitoxin module
MRRLGTIRVFTNKRMTLPDEFVKELDVEDGDYIDFFEDDDGKLCFSLVKGPQSGKKVNK